VYYQPNCGACTLCLPFRVRAGEFAMRRSQRRVWQRNADVEVRLRVPRATPEKEALYLRYQRSQHHAANEPFDVDYQLSVMDFQMYSNPAFTRELEYWLGDQLIGFGTVDLVEDILSAVYFVFDPDFRRRSPGIFNILSCIEQARQRGLRYVHLGYLIPGHPKMDYKRWFTPADLLNPRTREWERFTGSTPAPPKALRPRDAGGA